MAFLAEKIQAELVRSRSPLDDDQLAEKIGVRRQAINQECRYLASKGVIRRFHPSRSKILNEIFK
jgi:predicted transcriptional regulator